MSDTENRPLTLADRANRARLLLSAPGLCAIYSGGDVTPEPDPQRPNYLDLNFQEDA